MSGSVRFEVGISCPTPHAEIDRVQLGHGSGGKMSARLLKERFLPRLSNAALDLLGDGAVVDVAGARLAMSTDTFVVSPLEFPGGDIGKLAVHGTVNDVAMMGAEPLYLSLGLVLEEGLPFEVLDRVLDSIQAASAECGVQVVTGDTKVVERGKANEMFINTTGIGLLRDGFAPGPKDAVVGDRIIVSGPIARHGMAIMAAREGLEFEAEIESDTASLYPVVKALRDGAGAGVHVLRDATRGGIASALNEIAAASAVGVRLEGDMPVPAPVEAACEMLGLDPLYVANEGVLVAFVAADAVDAALDSMRAVDVSSSAMVIGDVVAEHRSLVVHQTALGASRIVDLLPGDQLPRIC